MAVVEQRVADLDLAADAVQDQVHLAQPPGGLDALLAKKGEALRAVGKAGRLHEHAA